MSGGDLGASHPIVNLQPIIAEAPFVLKPPAAMRVRQIGQSDVSDAGQPSADENGRTVQQQAVNHIGAKESSGGGGAPFHQQMIDMVE